MLLLMCSNVFMTFAWYGHLKFRELPLWKAVLISWGIAFIEYCLMVPANRYGAVSGLSGFQLKMTQEVITLVVFAGFSAVYLGHAPTWNTAIGFALIAAGAYFVFRG